jgi:tetratricopeptide (TPR) repeat protein
MSREEAVAFLCRRTDSQDEQASAALAEVLGDLPLALAEAAAYIEQTQIGLDEYLELVRGRTVELSGPAQPARAHQRVATVWSLSLEQVRVEAPAAEALLDLCAFFAPEDVPRNLPREHLEVLPEELRRAAGDSFAYNDLLGVLGRYSLASVTSTSLALHRLVQAVIRARLQQEEGRWAQVAVKLLDRAFSNEPWELPTWPVCRRLLPHVLAATDHAVRLGIADEETGWLLQRAATYLRSRGQLREARPLAERALDLTEEALGPDDPEVGYRCDELGRVLRELGQHEAARQQLARALAIHQNAYGADDENVGYRHSELGLGLHELGDLTGARAEYQRALVIGQATLDRNDPELATRHNNLGSVLRQLGDLADARAELEEALEIGQTSLAPNHPNMAAWHNNLGLVLRDLRDLDGARAQFEQALAIGEATLGPDHLNMAAGHNNLGTVLRALGNLDEAHAQFEQALAIGEATLGVDHPSLAPFRRNLDNVSHELGGR